jgi:probable F420-dependent oxidoreductase
MHPFRFGIQVSELPFDGWRERVRWYEELGFTTISTPDHYMMRQWDPVSLMAAVAGATRSAAVGSTVLNVRLRQPIDLARMAATVAAISAGGCELGLGAGWSPDDFTIAGMDFGTAGARLERLDETVQAIRLLWTQQSTDFPGRHVRLAAAPSVLALPLRRMPKLLLGGTLRRALGIVGRHADIASVSPSVASGKIGWPGWAEGSTVEQTAQQAAWVRAGAERAGRDTAAIELSTQLCFTAVAADPAPLQAAVAGWTGVAAAAQALSTIFLAGTPAEARACLQRRREATGLSYFVVFDLANNYVNPGTWTPSLPGDGGPGAADRYLEAFAESVVRPLPGQ